MKLNISILQARLYSEALADIKSAQRVADIILTTIFAGVGVKTAKDIKLDISDPNEPILVYEDSNEPDK